MVLDGFTVENYRSFLRVTEIDLRPLTLLFGYNSVGKSALLRLLPLLASSIGGDCGGPFALQSPAGRGATFSELRSRYGASPLIRFGLRFGDGTPAKVDFAVREIPERKRQLIDQLTLDDNLVARWIPQVEDPAQTRSRYELLSATAMEAGASLGLHFDGLLPSAEPGAQGPLVDRLPAVRENLRAFARGVHWIGALRSAPARWILYNTPRTRLQPDGSGAGASEVLAYDSLEGGVLLDEVSQWYRAATRHQLVVLPAPNDLFRLVLTPLDDPKVQIHIQDTGEGMAQVLPVVVLGAMARHGRLGPNPLLAIEQPELHLHPAAQIELARYFCQLTASSGKDAPARPKVLIETHSENLLLRVQLEIVSGTLDPKDVIVYWIRQTKEGPAVIEPIRFDDLARPINNRWPPGVFSEDVEQARELALRRRGRG